MPCPYNNNGSNTMTKYNPDIHHRKSIRLKNYDYSQSGVYFITICTKDRELYFENESIKSITKKYWKEIPRHFKNVKLDEFIIMPNHLHGIIVIHNDFAVGTGQCPVQNRFQNPGKESLSTIIGSFKSITTRTINKTVGTGHCPVQIGQCGVSGQGSALSLQQQKYFAWQSRFYEHIVREENELNKIREYIINNPLKWELDFENPERKKEYKNFADYLREKME